MCPSWPCGWCGHLFKGSIHSLTICNSLAFILRVIFEGHFKVLMTLDIFATTNRYYRVVSFTIYNGLPTFGQLHHDVLIYPLSAVKSPDFPGDPGKLEVLEKYPNLLENWGSLIASRAMV